MLPTLTILLVCQLIGELLVRLLGWPVPGPVLGMVLMFTLLAIQGGVPEPVQAAAGGLLDHLSLLFVPAGVGVMLHLRLIAAEWPAIATALVVSTVATIAVTGVVMARLAGSKP